MRTDEHGQQVGAPVPGWTPRPAPRPVTLDGRWCRLVPYAPEHDEPLHVALDLESSPTVWSYYPSGPHRSTDDLRAWLGRVVARPDQVTMTVLSPAGAPLGVACYLRIDPPNGSVEVGNIVYGSALQRTTAATEAMYLMMRHAFDDLGYRRYEWKCDALNAPSRDAAERLGFTYEGTFRNAVVYRGRNRDTAWFSVTDAEWPRLRTGLERWLDPANFDADGRQRTALDVRTRR
ncbi:GNAT family protein [Phycicoccus sp. CSK15P-2]|uniref:GNAT family N-acetyltransferase n=1 Tax=Phycicoccus sp. CSK15P-2 TaxID=2807627 RepID=UPI0027DBA264|nr:GNAT family protein [Phycicoccus sp. CSK15P-2]